MLDLLDIDIRYLLVLFTKKMVTKGQSADHPKFLWSNTGHYFQGQPKQRPDSLIEENFWKIIKV